MTNKENATAELVVDNAWTTSMKERLEELHCRQACIIYRVPQSIRQVDNDAYNPKIVSIGPYHRGLPRLQAMEEHKLRFLQDQLSLNPKMKLENYLLEMKKLEETTRSCYSESIVLQSKELVEMMLLDGCFIVQFLIKLKDSKFEFIFDKNNKSTEPIFNTIWMVIPIVHDILLLENQIPFFILQRLFEMAEIPDRYSSPTHNYLFNLTFEFFKLILPTNEQFHPDPNSTYHLLHLFHGYLRPKQAVDQSTNLVKCLSKCHLLPVNCIKQQRQQLPPPPPAKRPKKIPCATELQESGIRFKEKKMTEPCSFVDIKFSKGVLEIPTLHIYENTNSNLRNLIAFEQCHPNSETYCTAYAMFVDNLIKTPQDVILLNQNGIIYHGLGSDKELSLLFNKLCKGHNFYTSRSHLFSVYVEVHKYWENIWHKWRASLVRNYFNNPWSILSMLAAILLLFLTIAQTYFSAIAHFDTQPPPLKKA